MKKKKSSMKIYKQSITKCPNMTVIILGDMNAKIAKEDEYQNTAGKHTLHEITNRNGEWVCGYAIANNMKIISTYYQHKRIRKGTWISPDGNTLNQIDHVIIDANKKEW
jgi:endonuclease/exonuclease/phosphatase family metal-dependent hydrolase